MAGGCDNNGFNAAAAVGGSGSGGYRRQKSFRGLVSGDQAMKVGFDREQWMGVDDSKGKLTGWLNARLREWGFIIREARMITSRGTARSPIKFAEVACHTPCRLS